MKELTTISPQSTRKAQAKKKKSASRAHTAKEKSSSSAKSTRKISIVPVKCLKSHGKKGGKNQPKEDKVQPSREVKKNVSASKTGPGPGAKVKKKHMGNAVEEKSSLIESVTAQELQIAGIFRRITM